MGPSRRIAQTTKVADLGILGLARGAPALTSLDLSGCTGVTDAGVAHLSSLVVAPAGGGGGSGGRLERLRLDGLTGLSDDGLDALFGDAAGGGSAPAEPASSLAARAAAARATGGGAAASHAPSSRLRVLSLAGCAGVTDEGLALVGACPPLRASLRELDASGTSATEPGLLRLIDPSPPASSAGGGGAAVVGRRVLPLRLESLALPARGRGVTGAGLAALSSGLTSLTALDLEGCCGPGVTSQALAGE